MAAKVNKINNIPAPAVPPKGKRAAVIAAFVPDPSMPSWIYNFRIQAIIVALLAILFYANTFNHESAHDDTMVIVQNEYVLEGIKGIPSILTKDAYDSYYKQFNSGNQLSGGRYRPLSIITFAIEQEFVGTVKAEKIDSFLNHPVEPGQIDPWEKSFKQGMHMRHVLSVLWYALSVVILLYFLRQIVFKNNPVMAFIAAIIFTIHPIHTEVVANVKSRDEVISTIFICLTFLLAFKYEEEKKKWVLASALGCFFLAFLSKEYAITLLALLPLAFYLFKNYSLPKSIMATVPYVGLVIAYVFMRSQIVGPANPDSVNEILNNPYAFAVGNQKLATEIATTLDYLKLLIFPHPLSADYSYNSIPYKEFSHPLVWLSLLVHGFIIWAFFYYFKRRHVLSFAIAFYMLNLLLICNIVFDIGATMGERLIYHSSVGFAIALAYFLYKGMEQIKPAAVGKGALAAFMVIIIALCGYKTIDRNKAWKNDLTLFHTDIHTVPNSALVNSNVAASLIDKSESEKDEKMKVEDIKNGIKFLDKAIELHPTYVTAYLNKALAYFKLRQPDSVVKNLDIVRTMYPNHPKLPEMYYNAGVNFYLNKNYQNAITAWQITLKIKPGYPQAQNAINVLMSQQQQPH